MENGHLGLDARESYGVGDEGETSSLISNYSNSEAHRDDKANLVSNSRKGDAVGVTMECDVEEATDGEENEDEQTSLLSQSDSDIGITNCCEDNKCNMLDHPLRSLSCLSLDENEPSGKNESNDVPDVKISTKSTNDDPARKSEEHSMHSSECIPLRAIFHPEGSAAEHHWAEQIGYKNWLLHLTRRRRCELWILIGFLMWLAFFIVLAIVLNGNSSKSSENAISDDQLEDKKLDHPSFNSNVTASLPVMTTGIPHDVTSSGNRQHPATTTSSSVPDNKTNSMMYRLKPRKMSTIVPQSSKISQITESRERSGGISEDLQKPSTDSTIRPYKIESVTSSPGSMSSPVSHDQNMFVESTVPFVMETQKDQANYLIGVGRADITGPAADTNMMGYANPSQTSNGLHLRQFSRAFIIEDKETNIRTVFVNIDACMTSTLVKLEVLKKLKLEFGDLYRAENLCISGTHTHSGPAGFLQDVLFQITSLGYVDETLTVMVKGIVESIRKAHNSIQPGYIMMNKGELVGSNINRSPTAYANNPAEERAKYKYNVDTDMVLLKFLNENGDGIGMINWFPVHCTSMNNSNQLISSDNKGYAEILFEQFMSPNERPGKGNFVAAFAQSNEGDVSPNTRGPHCTDTGKPCDGNHSTCNGKSQLCVATGPGKDMFESTKIIGENQFLKAKDLYVSASVKLEGPVKFVHQYIDMTNYEVALKNSSKVRTCKPAMGFSFAAGTTDGPGAFDFKQGDKNGNKFWNLIRNFLHSPSEEQIKCHHPKPILLDTGEMEKPYEWQPKIVDTQILQIGQFLIIALPGEFSTMAGRRLRDGVLEVYKSSNPEVSYEAAIAGLANSYSDYITTHEEYLIQRYEGASTIYGPYTALAYTQQYSKLAGYLIEGKNVTSKVDPLDIKEKLYSFQLPVIYDRAPLFYGFGDVLKNVEKSYTAGEEVSVKFVAGNPRNCLKLDSNHSTTFSTVEKEMLDGSWDVIFTDADWDTKFTWIRTSTITATSDALITWQTHKTTTPGKYRISHYGCRKSLMGGIYAYSGKSGVFTITPQ